MNPVRAWNRFFFGPISARPLGLFRIVFGVVILSFLALRAFDFDYWFTDAGLLQGSEAREAAGPLRFSPLQYVQDPVSVRTFMAATALITLLFTLGWRTRLMTVLLYFGMLSLLHRDVVSNCGIDSLIVIMLFYMMFASSGAAYSFDALREARRRGTVAEPLIIPWPQRLIQIQLVMIYFATAIYKCNGATWLNGTAIYYILQNTEVGRFRLDPLSEYPLAINVLTHSALVAEFSLVVLLWFRSTRPWAILAGIGLHIGVLFTVNIPTFGEMMTACYLTFVTPEELDAFGRLVDPRNWFRRKRAVSIPGRVDRPSRLRGPHDLAALQAQEQLTLFEVD